MEANSYCKWSLSTKSSNLNGDQACTFKTLRCATAVAGAMQLWMQVQCAKAQEPPTYCGRNVRAGVCREDRAVAGTGRDSCHLPALCSISKPLQISPEVYAKAQKGVSCHPPVNLCSDDKKTSLVPDPASCEMDSRNNSLFAIDSSFHSVSASTINGFLILLATCSKVLPEKHFPCQSH